MLARLKIGTALSLGFTGSIGAALLIALAAWVGLRGVEHEARELSDLALPSTRALAKFDEARADIQRNLNALMLRRLEGELRRDNWDAVEDALKRFHDARREFEEIAASPETDTAWRAMSAVVEPWEKDVYAALDLVKERERLLSGGISWEAPQLKAHYEREWARYVEMRRYAKSLGDELAKVRAAVEKEARGHADQARTTARRAELTLLGILGLGAALLAVLAVALTRGISRAVQGLTSESTKLSSAVQAGKLQARADTHAVHFQFRGVVEGMNATMDAFVRPIEMASVNMERISRGDIPEQITGAYEGDFEDIKQSVNRCIGAVGAVVEDGKALATAATQGNLSARADGNKHQGEFRKIVEGFNRTLDSVMKPVEEATGVLQRLARRDLRARVEGRYQGDHAKITEALNATAEALHDALAQVAEAVGQVSSASSQIASSSQAVASGASEQASSLEETGSSLESISGMTKQAADNSQQASVLATAAKSAAGEGSAAMERMTEAMVKIRASAEGTSQIIKDINEIAFQTNLLALNAAVEAARAGEAGRGFAVVAEEVRSLALRSKAAANKTEELIRQSVREAGEGEVTAKHVNVKLSEIVTSVSKVTDIVAEISAAAREQAAGIEQVNTAIGQMNSLTQQNAASSEESSSAAAELSGQSEQLAAMVGAFQLDGVAGARRPAPKALPSPARSALPGLAKGRRGTAPRPHEVIPLDEESMPAVPGLRRADRPRLAPTAFDAKESSPWERQTRTCYGTR